MISQVISSRNRNIKIWIIIIILTLILTGILFFYSFLKKNNDQEDNTDNLLEDLNITESLLVVCVNPSNISNAYEPRNFLCSSSNACAEALIRDWRSSLERIKFTFIERRLGELLKNESYEKTVHSLNGQIESLIANITSCEKFCKIEDYRFIEKNETCSNNEITNNLTVKGTIAQEIKMLKEKYSCNINDECLKIYSQETGVCYNNWCYERECISKLDCASKYPGEKRMCENSVCVHS